MYKKEMLGNKMERQIKKKNVLKKLKKGCVVALTSVILLETMGMTSVNAASWKQDNAGWWYQYDNGSYPVSTWVKDKGTWYHFNSKGYMDTGWILDDGTWYYLRPSGVMATGWLNDSGAWYYLNGSGAMAVNCWIGNYYVGSSGAMLINTWTPDGYYVGSDGAWIPGYQKVSEGWKKDTAGWWYQNADGSYPANGWKLIKGNWYYFNAAGYMAANKWIGNYYVGNSGAMLTSTWTPDGYYVGGDGAWIPDYKEDKHKHEWTAVTNKVYHPAKTQTVTKVIEEAWTEEIPVYGEKAFTICEGCGSDFTGAHAEHAKELYKTIFIE